MQIKPILISIILFTCFCGINAEPSIKKERRASSGPRIPAISISEAIQLAVAHHKKENPQGKEIFVDEAVFVRTTGESYWKIGVRQRKHETGHLYYKVTSAKDVTIHSVVKDG